MGSDLSSPCCCSNEEAEGTAAVIVEGQADNEREKPLGAAAIPVVSAPAVSEPTPTPLPTDDSARKSKPVTFEFDNNGTSVASTFTSRPLGMTFANKLPLTVTKVVPGTEAERLGVQPGWVFTKVAGVPLNGLDLERVLALIQQKSSDLAPSASGSNLDGATMTFEFEVQGQLQNVTFRKRPLGMTFANKLPLTVTKVIPGSEAEIRGVQAGWVFTKVGDVDLTGMGLEKIVSLILEKSIRLPMSDA